MLTQPAVHSGHTWACALHCIALVISAARRWRVMVRRTRWPWWFWPTVPFVKLSDFSASRSNCTLWSASGNKPSWLSHLLVQCKSSMTAFKRCLEGVCFCWKGKGKNHFTPLKLSLIHFFQYFVHYTTLYNQIYWLFITTPNKMLKFFQNILTCKILSLEYYSNICFFDRSE